MHGLLHILLVLAFQSRSRRSSGALINSDLSWLIVCVLAFTALLLATDNIRSALATPDCDFGVAVALPERTVRAALSASVGSDFP